MFVCFEMSCIYSDCTYCFVFFKQKTAYEMRISDWSSDVCSSDLYGARRVIEAWQDDVPPGKQTDFFRSVKAESGEIVVFSFVEWSSREACDADRKSVV